MSDPTDLTAFQRDMLRLLAKTGPTYGLGLKRELEEWLNEPVNHGRLYPNLDQLVDDGYIEKSERDKRTNEYALTDRGKGVVEGFHGLWRDGVNAVEDREVVKEAEEVIEEVEAP